MKVEQADVAEVSSIVELILQLGLFVDEAMVRRFFFESPCLGWTPEVRGGFVVKDDQGMIVGFCGLSPCDVSFYGKTYPAYQMGVLGILPHYGAAMFEIMDRVDELTDTALVFANTANEKSAKLWTGYAGFQFGPSCCGSYQFEMVLPGVLSFLIPYNPSVFRSEDVKDFLKSLLISRGDLVTVRNNERFEWLYGGHMGKRKFTLIMDRDKKGMVSGYSIICSKPIHKLPFRRFEIMDIMAMDDSHDVLQRLVAKTKRYAALHGGVLVEYIGNRVLLKRRRKIAANPFIWKTAIPELRAGLNAAPRSFFGPYDGDRSLG